MLPLSELARIADGRLVGRDRRFDGVGTDSRTLNPGDLFVALRGPNFDGHDYLQVAKARGAAGALVEHAMAIDLPQVEVADSLRSFGRLARDWRQRCPARVIAITGSNGKTTLKEMTAGILARRGEVLATRGNLNNDIGVPLTLCRLRDERFAVIELGANHPGEIDYLTGLARPDVAVLNNAGRAHLEGFGSLEGVARAKAEIIRGLGPDGIFVFNADDHFAGLWRGLSAHLAQRTFGVREPADVSSPADSYRIAWSGGRFEARFTVFCDGCEIDVRLGLAGEHNRMNALAAVAGSIALGAEPADVAPALAALQPVPGRLSPVPGINGARLIDDSYNANPDSVLAALQVLVAAPGRRTLVLGDLAELGVDDAELHRELGRQAAAAGIDRLVTVGRLSELASEAFGSNGRHFADRRTLVESLAAGLSDEDSVLVKGSRSARMDEVVASLRHAGDAC